ncbi:hypothetical protein GCM10025868_45160 [Angustibacter aerolatus]|uniref:Nuclease SbcCD subunit C n=1 Tax=Angustibacter aerolatus TaxID=1162965 RepID=A0ABQ6JNW7_9ACTN|nr:hypothetical protein [Angustibacter aerolatus]GMA89266.1 hypothetical protein GCM10025868_45160 [Angustibacter aerolatus]
MVHEQRRADEAGLLLRDLLGMDLQQFTKVVMLPQGEFAAFLRAGADERRDLLSRLFDIDRYDAVERWLREERTAVGAQVHTADARQALLVARAEQAVHAVAPASGGGDDEVVDEPGRRLPDPVERVAAMLRGARAAADAAELDVARHGAVAQQAATTVQRLGRRAARCERLRALHERHDRLVAIRPRRDADAEQARARSGGCASSVPARRGRPGRRRTGRRPHPARGGRRGGPPPGTAGRRAARRAWPCCRRPPTSRRRLALATDRCAGLQREARDADRAGERAATGAVAARATHDAAQQQLGDALARADDLDAATAAEAGARTVLAAAEALPGAERDLAAAAERHDAARRHGRRLASGWSRSARPGSTAWPPSLASTLREGEPCTVCGSAEHPHPARPGAAHVDHAVEQEAAAAVDAARVAVDAALQVVHERTARRAEPMAAAGGSPTSPPEPSSPLPPLGARRPSRPLRPCSVCAALQTALPPR